MRNKLLPEKTVERLSEYRRSLLNCLAQGRTHIYSHDLAGIHNITAVQVRRDIMFIGYTSSQRKGYDVNELITVIRSIIDTDDGLNVAVFGLGNLGKAVTHYFKGKRSRLNIVATFDIDESKAGQEYEGVKCYSMNDYKELIKSLKISIALLTVPGAAAVETTTKLIDAGIEGILNFTTVPLIVPDHVFLEEYDMITSLEKIAYYVKANKGLKDRK
ncbi:MAG: redox-sensing transcriptional repressor Rex [Bacteroidales bacterium]|nr:redox-sensing transcriptional repressor Rex [Bacteroidales bacterium]MCF8390487.1 redox-sensing transcriptional repressor Rex [Bacteroidales bacterium]